MIIIVIIIIVNNFNIVIFLNLVKNEHFLFQCHMEQLNYDLQNFIYEVLYEKIQHF